jgi:hypothetical protein
MGTWDPTDLCFTGVLRMQRLDARPLRIVFLALTAILLPSRAPAQALEGKAKRFFVQCPGDPREQCITFDRNHDTVDLPPRDVGFPEDAVWAVREAIRSSKILFSGTVLRVDTQLDCSLYEWFVVAQTMESSNVLIYDPTDIGSEYCDTSVPGTPYLGTGPTWVYLVLPVHVMWAEISGYQIERGDSFHKPPSKILHL